MLNPSPVAIVIATKNRDKFKEIKAFFDAELGEMKMRYSLHSLLDMNIPETVEDCDTLHDNAEKKSREAYDALNEKFQKRIILADDTGLIVPSLGGTPGVYSARYAADRVQGRKPTYDENVSKLLAELDQLGNHITRDAYFLTVIAITHNLFGTSERAFVEGRLEGVIIKERRGTEGFGYDPVFGVTGIDKTLAELTLQEKNKISHRAKALVETKNYLKSLFEIAAE